MDDITLLSCADMQNINIEQTENGTYVVKADTERFGMQEILYESFNYDDCTGYIDRCKMAAAQYINNIAR